MTITPGEEALAEVPFRVGDKTALGAITTFTNDTTAAQIYNLNNTTITAALDNALSRNGLMPNQMGGNIDMNSNHVLNLPAPFSPDEPMRVVDMQQFTAGGTINFNAIPTGGAPNQVLTKNTFSNFDVSWQSIPTVTGTLPTGGTVGQFLIKNSSLNFDSSWATEGTLPTGGTTDQVLAKTSGTNFATTWQSSGVPRGGTSSQVLTKNSGTDFDASWTSTSISGTLPTGGTTGQVLAKNSATNFDANWFTIGEVPIGGTTGQVLTKNSSTNFDTSWATSTGGGGVTTGSGIVFSDAANVIFTNSQGVISPGHGSVAGNGSTNDTSAISGIISSFSEIHFLPGNYLINGLTVGTGKRLVMHAGAKFTITTGSTLDVSGSTFQASLNLQCFVLQGTATVVGLTDSSPEMFGAVRNGSTDDSNAVKVAINSVAQVGANPTIGRPTCHLTSGTYFCASVINIAMPNSGPNFRISGAGSWTTQSRLVFKSTLSGSALQFFQSAGGNMSFVLDNFMVINQTAGSGCSQGIDIGWIGTHTINTSDQPGLVVLDTMWVSGFATNVRQIGMSGILVRHCQFWGTDSTFSSSTTNAVHYLMTAGGINNAGQLCTFLYNTFVQDGGSSGRAIWMNDASLSGSSNAGVQIVGNLFYAGAQSGATCIYMQGTASSGTAGNLDIWIMHNQFENQTSSPQGQGTAIVMQAANGSFCYDVHIDHNYFNGQGWNGAIFGQAVDNLSTMGNMYVTNNYFENPTSSGVSFTGVNTGGGTYGYVVSNNMFACGESCNILVQFNNLVGNVAAIGNNSYKLGSPTISNGIAFTGLGGNATVVGNNTNASNPVSTGAGSWTNVSQANNI